MNRRDRPWLRVIAPLSLMVVIFILSAQPGGGDHPWWDVILRKLGHIGGYALLAGLWWWALRRVVGRPLVWAAGISLAYACTDEFHQTFVRDRTGTPVDVAIDAIGIALAALLISLKPRAAKTEPGKAAGSSAKRAHLERA